MITHRHRQTDRQTHTDLQFQHDNITSQRSGGQFLGAPKRCPPSSILRISCPCMFCKQVSNLFILYMYFPASNTDTQIYIHTDRQTDTPDKVLIHRTMPPTRLHRNSTHQTCCQTQNRRCTQVHTTSTAACPCYQTKQHKQLSKGNQY